MITAERWPSFNPHADAGSWDAELGRKYPDYVPIRLRCDEIIARIDDPTATDSELRKRIPESVAIGRRFRELCEETELAAKAA
jgi:hypothetical protein